jgi:hypothetical protein
MGRTVFDKLGYSLRLHVGVLLFGLAVSLVVGLLTGRPILAVLVLNGFNMVICGIKYRDERSVSR